MFQFSLTPRSYVADYRRAYEGGFAMARLAIALALVPIAACSLPLEAPPKVVHARFDPSASILPMPTDLVRDDQTGLLALPIADDLSPAEKELRGWLNQQDGWPSTIGATVSFDAPVAPDTIDQNTVQIWRWGDQPTQLETHAALDRDGTTLSLTAPEEGWERGRTYAVVVRGGRDGLRGVGREPVIADAAFYFLRLEQRLDDPAHQRAFPGDTREARLQAGRDLEAVRQKLLPYFDHLEARGLRRDEIAALWTFTAQSRVELAMDKASQRMPVPFDLLIDRHTGRVDIPARASDSAVEAEGKKRLADYDGWGLSAGLIFETNGELGAAVGDDAVELYDLSDVPKRVPAKLKIFSDRRHVEVMPETLPLKEGTTYGVVVRDKLVADDGRAVAPMTIGALMRLGSPVEDGGKSQIGSLADEDAARVEWTRKRITGLLDQIGRDHVVTAWPFTTQTVVPRIDQAVARAASVAGPAAPQNLRKLTPLEAVGDFALGITSLLNVKEVYYGTLKLPSWLDERTRAWRADNEHAMRDVHFAMTIPRGTTGKVPVVIFGHAIATERRFVLAVGDALARRGFAAISIDFPYHGEQTRCIEGGLIAVPDPQTGEIRALPPCESGYTCNDYGKCVDASGQGHHVAKWPVLSFPVASGAAFLEIEHIANTRDHFLQAVIDLNGLHRSLKQADWSKLGIELDTSTIHYAGQSLGGILGATFVSMNPEIKRAVLNVPGADLVDMFRESTYFASHVNAFFTREKIDPESWQAARFLNLARLIVDGVDPQSVGHKMRGRDVMIQMATLDFIIPNRYTETLQRISGAPKRDYLAEHAFIVIPVEPAFLRGQSELADFLDGSLQP
jgi:dienelactone hydrolase